MATLKINNIKGIDTATNPLLQGDGNTIFALNVDTDPVGAITKRSGYQQFLNIPDTDPVNSLFDWHKNNGTEFWLYRASGSSLYYSTQGTGDWTICGNGTIASGSAVGHAVSENTLIVGDGFGSTRHTTNGTSFTNTVAAPISNTFEEYQGRIYAGGTASNLFYSTVGTPSDWVTDSASYLIPGEGKNDVLFKQGDRLFIGKSSNRMFKWDGYRLFDLAITSGPSSRYSIGNYEDLRFWLTRIGIAAFDGTKPKYISTSIQNQIFNASGSGISGTSFDAAQGVVHQHSYLVTAGAITDTFVNRQIDDSIIKYDIQNNSYVNYHLATYPTSWLSFIDDTRTPQFIFGDPTGICSIFDSSKNDDGSPISVDFEMVIHAGTLIKKDWHRMRLVFNPRCQAQVSIAVQDTFDSDKRWTTISNSSDTGRVEYYFKNGERSSFLFVRIVETSVSTAQETIEQLFKFYGMEIDYEPAKN